MNASVLVSFLIGFSLWPALEYGLHAGLGHLFLRGKTAFSKQHTRHHGQKDWFAPTWQKVLAAVPVLCLTFTLCYFITPWQNAAALTLGFAVMYFTYEYIHLRAHTHPPRGPYGRWVRRNHFSHHFQNPRKNHGVTSPIFDYLFGSHVPPGKVVVPERFALRWLIDPKTGEVWDYLANDYELKRASKKVLKKQNNVAQDIAAALNGEAPVY